MRSSFLIACLALTSAVTFGDDAAVDLSKIDRTIVREPDYQGQPHYALFVLGPKGDHRSWLVIDGDRVAYIDRNGNGDLTEPEDRVGLDVEATNRINLVDSGAYKAMHMFPLDEIAGTKLMFQLWVRNPDFDPSQVEVLREYLAEFDKNRWVNGSLLRIGPDGSIAQTPLLLTVRPEDAQICRFDGPLTAALKWEDRQKLEPWPKQTVFDIHIGYRNLLAKDCDRQTFAFTRLSTGEVPEFVQPVARFQFPGSSGEKPVTRELRLDERCCGDTFYCRFTLPKEVVEGNVKVTVEFPDWKGQGVEAAVFEIPVNQERSRHSEAAYIMFHRPGVEIKDAANALRKRGLDVYIRDKGLLIDDDGKPAYSVQLVRSDKAQNISSALGKGTPHAAQLSRCDARFEIWLMNVEKSLQDQALLTEIRSALQELTAGYAYQTWDKQLIPPR